MDHGVYAAAPGHASALGDGSLLWRRDDDEAIAVLDAEACALLQHCEVYDTLESHAARAAAAQGIDPARALAVLRELAARALLIGLDAALAQAAPRAEAAPRPRVLLRLLGDGSALADLLTALAAALPADLRTAVDVLLPAAAPGLAAAAPAALDVRVIDAPLRAALLTRWSASLAPAARAALAALFDEAPPNWPRTSWHWALLLARGTTAALIDDHGGWPPRLAPQWQSGLTLATPARRGAWLAPRSAAPPGGVALPDPLGVASQYLGQPARTLAAAYPGTAARARGLPLDAVLCPNAQARVRVIALGHGLRAAPAPTAPLGIDDGFDGAAWTALLAAAPSDAPHPALAVANRIGALVRASPLQPVFVDARSLLPPWPPRGAASAWLALIQALDAGAVVLELPVLLPGRIDAGDGHASALAASIAAAAQGFAGADRTPAQLAARLADLAEADAIALAQRIRARTLPAVERRLASLRTALSAAPDSKGATSRDYAAAAEAWLAEPVPERAAADLSQALAELADVLPAWDSLWQAAAPAELAR